MASCPDDDSGAGAGDFLGLSGHDYRYSSCGDLYELVVRGGGCITVSRPHVQKPEVMPRLPPSEEEMARWLHPIIAGGQTHASQATDDGLAQAKETNKNLTDKLDKKLPTVEYNSAGDITSDSRVRKKTGGGGAAARRSNNAVTHSQTEKRRRSKINESLKALQQLVPGCDELSNQASTLDQTIQYLKLLQHQVHAMSVSMEYSMRSVSLAPGIHVGPAVVLGAPPPMVPFAPMIPAVMMPAPMIYPPTTAPDVAHARWPSSGK